MFVYTVRFFEKRRKKVANQIGVIGNQSRGGKEPFIFTIVRTICDA